MPQRKYLTTDDVAVRHGRSPRTIRDWINKGCVTPRGRLMLPAVLAGKSYEIEMDDLELFEARLRAYGSRSPIAKP